MVDPNAIKMDGPSDAFPVAGPAQPPAGVPQSPGAKAMARANARFYENEQDQFELDPLKQAVRREQNQIKADGTLNFDDTSMATAGQPSPTSEQAVADVQKVQSDRASGEVPSGDPANDTAKRLPRQQAETQRAADATQSKTETKAEAKKTAAKEA